MQNKSPQSAMNRPSMDAMNRLLRILLLSSVFHVISAQTGILSIDCGANESYADPVTKTQWVPDTNYTNSGLKSNVANQNVAKELRTLRYFPNSSISNCYVMPISTNQIYSCRAIFLYGNYDAKNHWPSFNLSFDVGNVNWWTHEFVGTHYSSNRPFSVELIFPAKQSSNLSLCFSSNDPIKDVPFISSLELRPLPQYFNRALNIRARTYSYHRDANSILISIGPPIPSSDRRNSVARGCHVEQITIFKSLLLRVFKTASLVSLGNTFFLAFWSFIVGSIVVFIVSYIVSSCIFLL